MTAKIKETASNTYVLSTIYNLDVIDPPLPTSTPTPTVSPPTNTPIPTATPKPSLTPTTTPTSTPTIEPTPTVILISPTGEVLGFSETASPTTIIKKDQNNITPKENYLPHIFVGIGSILLLVPLLIAKLGR